MTRYKFKWANRKNNSEHKVVYEENFGPVPAGFHVHHRDEDPWNNHPDNLEALDGLEHRRLHAENYRRGENGEWLKFCRVCGEVKPLDAFHARTTLKGTKSTKAECKPCRNAARRERHRLKKRKG
jgi:HNH endonuclease